MAFENDDFGYLIIRPDNVGIQDLFGFWNGERRTAAKIVESSEGEVGAGELFTGVKLDHRWVILVSIVVRKLLALFAKPMEWTGCFFEFILNLISNNGDLLGLLYNLTHGKVVMPHRDSETFISAIGYLDGRIDLYKSYSFGERIGLKVELGDRALTDLCMMASKLAYENTNVIRNIINHHWKMHFEAFYNGWNDYLKDRSTQVLILSDKPEDADLILVSFRGTEPFNANDWSTDFDYSWYKIPKLGKVHMGFLEALGLGNRSDTSTFKNFLQVKDGDDTTLGHSEAPEIMRMTAYYAVKRKLKIMLSENRNAKFIITGHSLGGALAILFPCVLVLHEEEELMQRMTAVYTFGSQGLGMGSLGSSWKPI
ncbi:Triacylglycerol lipase [Bertholletia excelsa]